MIRRSPSFPFPLEQGRVGGAEILERCPVLSPKYRRCLSAEAAFVCPLGRVCRQFSSRFGTDTSVTEKRYWRRCQL